MIRYVFAVFELYIKCQDKIIKIKHFKRLLSEPTRRRQRCEAVLEKCSWCSALITVLDMTCFKFLSVINLITLPCTNHYLFSYLTIWFSGGGMESNKMMYCILEFLEGQLTYQLNHCLLPPQKEQAEDRICHGIDIWGNILSQFLTFMKYSVLILSKESLDVFQIGNI